MTKEEYIKEILELDTLFRAVVKIGRKSLTKMVRDLLIPDYERLFLQMIEDFGEDGAQEILSMVDNIETYEEQF